MKHAILLMVHDNVPVVRTLLKMLDDERFIFYLLIDKKSPYVLPDYCPELKYSTVRAIPQIKLNWGGYSLIEGILLLLESAVKEGVDMCHYLQGADLPLKTPDQIDTFFQNKYIYVDVDQKPSDFACYKVLCKHWMVESRYYRNNRILKLLDHAIAHVGKPFMKMKKMYGKLYTGSALWSFSSEFAQYVLANKKSIKKMYRNSLAADEVFIQTLVMNSEYKNLLSKHGNARFIDWKNAEGNSPKTFTIFDSKEVSDAIQNPTLMFIRKIHANRDSEIMNYIYEMVGRNKTNTTI